MCQLIGAKPSGSSGVFYLYLWYTLTKNTIQIPLNGPLGGIMAKGIGRVSLARENEAGGRRSIFSMLTYRTLFCFWSK